MYKCIGMVNCVVVEKVIVDKGMPNFLYKFPRYENLKQQQWLIKIKRTNIQSIQHVRMCHAYCFG